MTPREAACDYAASLLRQMLAKAHRERVEGQIPSAIVSDALELAPRNVRAALDRGELAADAVTEAMAELADDLNRRVKYEEMTDEDEKALHSIVRAAPCHAPSAGERAKGAGDRHERARGAGQAGGARGGPTAWWPRGSSGHGPGRPPGA